MYRKHFIKSICLITYNLFIYFIFKDSESCSHDVEIIGYKGPSTSTAASCSIKQVSGDVSNSPVCIGDYEVWIEGCKQKQAAAKRLKLKVRS